MAMRIGDEKEIMLRVSKFDGCCCFCCRGCGRLCFSQVLFLRRMRQPVHELCIADRIFLTSSSYDNALHPNQKHPTHRKARRVFAGSGAQNGFDDEVQSLWCRGGAKANLGAVDGGRCPLVERLRKLLPEQRRT